MSTSTIDAPVAPVAPSLPGIDNPSSLKNTSSDLDAINIVDLIEDDDDENTSHYVLVPFDQMHKYTTEAWITKAIFDGIPLKALCGYEWVPSRDPKNLPLCSKCKAEAMRRNGMN